MATLTQKVVTIRSAFNVSTVPFAAQVAAWFVAHPGIIVQSLGYGRPDSTYRADDEVLRVAYLEATGDAIGGTWVATLYQTVGAITAQDAFNLDYATPGALPVIPIFVLDITDHEENKTGPESLLVIGIRTDVGPLGEVGYDRAVYIASPLADIAAGDTGNALLLDASGATVSLSIPITNVGAVTWVQDQRNYVVYDELEGVYIGIPSCCGADVWAPPVATTTTAFPCPASFPEANPTTVTNQPTTTLSTTTTTTTSTTTTSTTTTSTTTTSTTTTTTTTTSTTTTSTTTSSSSSTSTLPTCCQWFFLADYNCGTGLWTVFVNTQIPDQPCDVDSDWAPTGDPCEYSRVMYTAGGACSSPPDPGQPLGGAEPPDCCV